MQRGAARTGTLPTYDSQGQDGNMAAPNVLYVTMNTKDLDDLGHPTFAIKETISEMTQSEFERLYTGFANADVDCGSRIPIFEIMWKKAVVAERGVRLLHLIYLFEELSEVVVSENITVIRYDELDRKYEALVRDVAEAHSVMIEGGSASYRIRGAVDRLSAVLASALVMIQFLADQVVSAILGRIRWTPNNLNSVFVPVRGHFDRMEPVIAELDSDYELLIPTSTIRWLREREQYDKLTSHSPVPMNMMSSIRDILSGPGFLLIEAWKVVLLGELDDALKRFLTEEFQISMPNCIANETNHWLQSRSFTVSCLFFNLSSRVFDRCGCNSLAVGSAGQKGKAIMAGGDAVKADLYHIRHSVVTGYTPDPPFDSTTFVEGSIAMEQVEQAPFVSDTSNFVPSGYQYLADMVGRHAACYDPGDPVKILVATQPYENETKTAFINNVLAGVEAMPTDAEITIKTHPRESPDFYESVVPNDVEIADSNLHGYLNSSDLVLTINSNVGLEAMLFGTPCVCINEFEPMIQTMPYAKQDTVPLLQSASEVREYFDNLESEKLKSLQLAQRGTVEDGFVTDGTPARHIAKTIMEGNSTEESAERRQT